MNNYERDIRKIFARIQNIFRVFPNISIKDIFMDIWSYKIYALFFLFPIIWSSNMCVDDYGELSILYFICYSIIYLIFNKFYKRNCSVMADLGRPILVFFLLRCFVDLICFAPNWFCVLIFLFVLALVLIDWKSPISQYDKYLFLVLLFTMPTIFPTIVHDVDVSMTVGDIGRQWGDSVRSLFFYKNDTDGGNWRTHNDFIYNENYFKDVATNIWYTLNFLTIVIDLIIFMVVLFFKKRTARRLYKETTVESPTNSEKSIEKE